jgi:hypothetical protein
MAERLERQAKEIDKEFEDAAPPHQDDAGLSKSNDHTNRCTGAVLALLVRVTLIVTSPDSRLQFRSEPRP